MIHPTTYETGKQRSLRLRDDFRQRYGELEPDPKKVELIMQDYDLVLARGREYNEDIQQ